MGQPGTGDRATAQSAGRTRGTETSHYPEEKKTKVIAQVVASERAGAQTGTVEAATGVVGPPITPAHCSQGKPLERGPIGGERPVPEDSTRDKAAPE